jgi:hypothetical protein
VSLIWTSGSLLDIIPWRPSGMSPYECPHPPHLYLQPTALMAWYLHPFGPTPGPASPYPTKLLHPSPWGLWTLSPLSHPLCHCPCPFLQQESISGFSKPKPSQMLRPRSHRGCFYFGGAWYQPMQEASGAVWSCVMNCLPPGTQRWWAGHTAPPGSWDSGVVL